MDLLLVLEGLHFAPTSRTATSTSSTRVQGSRHRWGYYRSHTDRYQKDPGYRKQMSDHGVPEWLVFKSTGHTFRVDGDEGDQYG